MSARHGKIARLPLSIREELNTRILNGEPATVLVPWLNSQGIVKGILDDLFEGKPISEQNISNWREGGFVDWYVQEDWRAICRSCAQDADQVALTGFNAGKFLLMLTARLAVSLDAAESDPAAVLKDNPAFHKLIASVLRIHQSELKDARLALDRERLEFQHEKDRARNGTPGLASPFGPLLSKVDRPIPESVPGAELPPAPLPPPQNPPIHLESKRPAHPTATPAGPALPREGAAESGTGILPVISALPTSPCPTPSKEPVRAAAGNPDRSPRGAVFASLRPKPQPILVAGIESALPAELPSFDEIDWSELASFSPSSFGKSPAADLAVAV